MNSLTENLRAACLKLVRKELPEEAPVFDHIWDAFWKTLGCKNIEDLQANVNIGNEPVSIRTLGAVATGGTELESLFVLGSLTSSMVALHAKTATMPIDMENIAGTLKDEILRINTPDHLCPILFEHGMAILAGLFGVEADPQKDEAIILPGQLWVEHCEERTDSLEPLVVKRDRYDALVVEKNFRKQRHVYDLFVDEFSRGIYLGAKDVWVLWSELDPRHEKFLGIILEALGEGRTITNREIRIRVSDLPGGSHRAIDTGVRRNLSELHKCLKDVLKPIFGVRARQGCYDFKGRIPYCWIRAGDRSSRLISIAR